MVFKTIEYLEINLSREVRHLYHKNIKTIKKDNLRRPKGMEKLFMLRNQKKKCNKMTILPELLDRFNAIPLHIQTLFKDLEL